MAPPLVYVTWDGPSTNYLEALFAPMLARLDRQVTVVQATSASAERREDTRRQLAQMGVAYEAVEIRSGPGLAPRLVRARWKLWRVIASQPPGSTVMVRSVLAGLLTAGLRPHTLVFDSDGLLADERVEFAAWRGDGLPYRSLRALETHLVRRARMTLTRTERGRQVLLARAGPAVSPEAVVVVPNGRDPSVYRPVDDRCAARSELGYPPDAPVLLYCGSIGPQYLPEAMVALHRAVRRRNPKTRLVLLTGSTDAARAITASVPGATVAQVPAADVPRYLSAADVGLALRSRSFSQSGVCPIKVAEYLLCGLPCLVSSGVGDLDQQVAGVPSVRMLAGTSETSLNQAAEWILHRAIAHRSEWTASSVATGLRYFGLPGAVRSLDSALRAAEGRREP